MSSLLSEKVLFGLQLLVAESCVYAEHCGRKVLQSTDILSAAAGRDVQVVANGAISCGADTTVCLGEEIKQPIAFNLHGKSWCLQLLLQTPLMISMHVAEDLRAYYTAICKAVFSTGQKSNMRKMALNDISINGNIATLLPRFLATALRLLKVCEERTNARQLVDTLQLVCAIAHNPHFRIDIYSMTVDIIRTLLAYILEPASCIHRCQAVEKSAATVALLLRRLLPWRAGLYGECVARLLAAATHSTTAASLHYAITLVLASLHTDVLTALLHTYTGFLANDTHNSMPDLAAAVILRVAIRLSQHSPAGSVTGDRCSTPESRCHSVYQQLYSLYADSLANMLTVDCSSHVRPFPAVHTASKPSQRVANLLQCVTASLNSSNNAAHKSPAHSAAVNTNNTLPAEPQTKTSVHFVVRRCRTVNRKFASVFDDCEVTGDVALPVVGGSEHSHKRVSVTPHACRARPAGNSHNFSTLLCPCVLVML